MQQNNLELSKKQSNQPNQISNKPSSINKNKQLKKDNDQKDNIIEQFKKSKDQFDYELNAFQNNLNNKKSQLSQRLHIYNKLIQENGIDDLNKTYKQTNQILEKYVHYQNQVIKDLQQANQHSIDDVFQWKIAQANINSLGQNLSEMLSRNEMVEKLVKIDLQCSQIEEILNKMENQITLSENPQN